MKPIFTARLEIIWPFDKILWGFSRFFRREEFAWDEGFQREQFLEYSCPGGYYGQIGISPKTIKVWTICRAKIKEN